MKKTYGLYIATLFLLSSSTILANKETDALMEKISELQNLTDEHSPNNARVSKAFKDIVTQLKDANPTLQVAPPETPLDYVQQKKAIENLKLLVEKYPKNAVGFLLALEKFWAKENNLSIAPTDPEKRKAEQKKKIDPKKMHADNTIFNSFEEWYMDADQNSKLPDFSKVSVSDDTKSDTQIKQNYVTLNGELYNALLNGVSSVCSGHKLDHCLSKFKSHLCNSDTVRAQKGADSCNKWMDEIITPNIKELSPRDLDTVKTISSEALDQLKRNQKKDLDAEEKGRKTTSERMNTVLRTDGKTNFSIHLMNLLDQYKTGKISLDLFKKEYSAFLQNKKSELIGIPEDALIDVSKIPFIKKEQLEFLIKIPELQELNNQFIKWANGSNKLVADDMQEKKDTNVTHHAPTYLGAAKSYASNAWNTVKNKYKFW